MCFPNPNGDLPVQKRDIIFLHGFPFDGSLWAPQVEFIDGAHREYTPDLRGHRDGPASPGPWFVQDFADDLLAQMDRDKVERAILVGHSLGGYVALHFIQQHPDRVEGLVLANTRADADDNAAKDKRHATVKKLREHGMESFAADFTKAVLAESTLAERPEVAKKVAAMITANRVEPAALVVGALASRRDSTPFLRDIRVPTIVLAGEQDKIAPVEVMRVMAGEIRGSEFHVIPKAAHMAGLERPEEFNKCLGHFLRENF